MQFEPSGLHFHVLTRRRPGRKIDFGLKGTTASTQFRSRPRHPPPSEDCANLQVPESAKLRQGIGWFQQATAGDRAIHLFDMSQTS